MADGLLKLSGTVDFTTVPALFADTQLASITTIDWALVDKLDSAALALSLAWQGQAPKLKQINQPKALTALAEVYYAKD